MKRLLSLAAAAIFAGSTAQAALVVDITGTPGDGQTKLTFSGSSIARAFGFFEPDDTVGFGSAWLNLGDFANSAFLSDPVQLIGKAEINIEGKVQSIDAVEVRNSEFGDFSANDGLGIGVDGGDRFEFLAGEMISWSGSVMLEGLDIDSFNTGGQATSSFFTSNFGGTEDALDLELNIRPDEISAVPLPAGGVLLLSGLAGVAVLRRRRKSIT